MNKKTNGQAGGKPDFPELNEVKLAGWLVAPPEIKAIAGGGHMARFMLAVPRTFINNRQQESMEKAYVPVVAWHAVAKQTEGLEAGDAVKLEGRLKTWKSPDGEKYRWEVEAVSFQLLHRRPENAAARKEAAAA